VKVEINAVLWCVWFLSMSLWAVGISKTILRICPFGSAIVNGVAVAALAQIEI
jgi:hypothetical protein